MSSYQPRHREKDRRMRTSSDESDREVVEHVEHHHHRRHSRHHRGHGHGGGQRERRCRSSSWPRSRSRSRSRSPKHRKENAEHESLNHSRVTEHHPLKHSNQESAGNKRHGRHHKRDQAGWREEHDRDKDVKARKEDIKQMSAMRGKWDDDPGAETVSPRDKRRTSRGRENTQDSNRLPGQVRIKQERDWNDRRRKEDSKRKPDNPFQTGSGNADSSSEGRPPQEKDKPNFSTSGKLTEDTNTYRGVVIKYNEPSEARKPKCKWRLYVFKGDQELPIVHIHRQSAYLLGRERLIADLPIDHPSCSKQHAVLQYRLVQYERPDGSMGKRVRPYIIDLESSNGTYINNNRIEPKRYYELHEKDVLKFGYSTREYVLLHDKSKDNDQEDDVDD